MNNLRDLYRDRHQLNRVEKIYLHALLGMEELPKFNRFVVPEVVNNLDVPHVERDLLEKTE